MTSGTSSRPASVSQVTRRSERRRSSEKSDAGRRSGAGDVIGWSPSRTWRNGSGGVRAPAALRGAPPAVRLRRGHRRGSAHRRRGQGAGLDRVGKDVVQAVGVDAAHHQRERAALGAGVGERVRQVLAEETALDRVGHRVQSVERDELRAPCSARRRSSTGVARARQTDDRTAPADRSRPHGQHEPGDLDDSGARRGAARRRHEQREGRGAIVSVHHEDLAVVERGTRRCAAAGGRPRRPRGLPRPRQPCFRAPASRRGRAPSAVRRPRRRTTAGCGRASAASTTPCRRAAAAPRAPASCAR